MKPIDIGLIQARRKAISEELAKAHEVYQAKVAALEAEAKDLDVAERVFSKLAGGKPDLFAIADGNGQTKDVPQSSGKPEGLPPVTEMIREALGHAVLQGGYGYKPSGILSYIRGKWWPTAEPNDVGPIAWRMWQNDQIMKFKEGEYGLLEKERHALQKKLNLRVA